MIGTFSIAVGIFIMVYMQPITAHLAIRSDKNPLQHLIKTLSESHYLKAFLATTLLSTGGFMLMPFGSAFSIHNLGLSMAQLPFLYGITGIFTIAFGPVIGRISDKIGKYKMFIIGTIISITIVAIYTNLGITPLWQVIFLNVILFAGIMTRMISASALLTGIPEAQHRGTFMSINSSVQQISGGIASAVAGLIVVQGNGGRLERYNTLGYVVIGSMLVALLFMYWINQYVKNKSNAPMPPVNKQVLATE